MQQLRWGILGTGNIASQFADGVRGSRRGRLVAVASRDRERAEAFATRFGIDTVLGSYGEMCANDAVDAVYVSLPNTLHHEWTIKALRGGKHVLCEKPIAANARDAAEMYDVAQQTGRKLVEAFMYRAHPQTRRLREEIAAGVIGRLKLIRSSFCFRVRKLEGNIRFDPALAGGALMDVGCYCINLARMFAGRDVTDISATARVHSTGVDEQTSVILRFGQGADALISEFTCGMLVQADNTAHLCGDEGYITVGWPWKPPATVGFEIRGGIPPRQDNPGAKPVAPPPRVVEVTTDTPLYGIEADAFAEHVLDDAAPFMPPAETLDNMRTLDRVRELIGLAY